MLKQGSTGIEGERQMEMEEGVNLHTLTERQYPELPEILRKNFILADLPEPVAAGWREQLRGFLQGLAESEGWSDLLWAERKEPTEIVHLVQRLNLSLAGLASYEPSDERTIGPLGLLALSKGRCGEESLLLVAALRAIGIAARRVYARWWGHCDDNHAWFEYWDGEGWRFEGALEPEVLADQGWFRAAAARAPWIRTELAAGWQELAEAMSFGVATEMSSVKGKEICSSEVAEMSQREVMEMSSAEATEVSPVKGKASTLAMNSDLNLWKLLGGRPLRLADGSAIVLVTERYAETHSRSVILSGPEGPLPEGERIDLLILNSGEWRLLDSLVLGVNGRLELTLGGGDLLLFCPRLGLAALRTEVEAGPSGDVGPNRNATPSGNSGASENSAPDGNVMSSGDSVQHLVLQALECVLSNLKVWRAAPAVAIEAQPAEARERRMVLRQAASAHLGALREARRLAAEGWTENLKALARHKLKKAEQTALAQLCSDLGAALEDWAPQLLALAREGRLPDLLRAVSGAAAKDLVELKAEEIRQFLTKADREQLDLRSYILRGFAKPDALPATVQNKSQAVQAHTLRPAQAGQVAWPAGAGRTWGLQAITPEGLLGAGPSPESETTLHLAGSYLLTESLRLPSGDQLLQARVIELRAGETYRPTWPPVQAQAEDLLLRQQLPAETGLQAGGLCLRLLLRATEEPSVHLLRELGEVLQKGGWTCPILIASWPTEKDSLEPSEELAHFAAIARAVGVPLDIHGGEMPAEDLYRTLFLEPGSLPLVLLATETDGNWQLHYASAGYRVGEGALLLAISQYLQN